MRTALALSVLVLAACGGGTDGDNTPTPPKRVVIDVSGKVGFHPMEEANRAALSLGAAPSLQGLGIHVEDAFKARLGAPALKDGTIAADGSFAVPQVDVTDTSLALIASVTDPSNAVFQSAFGLVRGRPESNLTNMPVWVLSSVFVGKLATAVGVSVDALAEEGFVFGQIVDAQERPIEGAKLAKLSPEAREVVSDEEKKLYYLNADLTGTVDGATSASGAFILTNAGSAADYTALKSGMTFETRLSGSRKDAAVSAFIHAK